MRALYLEQVYNIRDHTLFGEGNDGHFSIDTNTSIMPNSLQNSGSYQRHRYCRHYLFSIFYIKSYYAINTHLSGHILQEFTANSDRIIFITEVRDKRGRFSRRDTGNLSRFFSYYRPLLLNGTVAKTWDHLIVNPAHTRYPTPSVN